MGAVFVSYRRTIPRDRRQTIRERLYAAGVAVLAAVMALSVVSRFWERWCSAGS